MIAIIFIIHMYHNVLAVLNNNYDNSWEFVDLNFLLLLIYNGSHFALIFLANNYLSHSPFLSANNYFVFQVRLANFYANDILNHVQSVGDLSLVYKTPIHAWECVSPQIAWLHVVCYRPAWDPCQCQCKCKWFLCKPPQYSDYESYECKCPPLI